MHCTNKEKAARIIKLWRKFFADPGQWWDNRQKKINHRFPDFVHSGTKEALWIDCWSNPSWLEAELAKLKQGDGNCNNGVKAKSGIDSEDSRAKCVGEAGNDLKSDRFQRLKKLCEGGQIEDALELVYQQRSHASTNDFYCLLLACIYKRDLLAGRQVHYLLLRTGFSSNTFLGCCLIRMFTSLGSLPEAKHVFSRLPKPNAFAWSAIISAHTKLGENGLAIELYFQMRQSSVKPDGHVYVAVLKACSSIEALDQGTLIHGHVMEGGIGVNAFIGCALIDLYSKCGHLEDARSVFDKLQSSTTVTWNAMLAGYAQNGYGKEALQLFQQMRKEDTEPSNVSLVCILKACSSIAALEQAKVIHAYIVERGSELDAFVGNSLIDLYAKCGSLPDARNVFGRLPNRDVVAWCAIISGSAQFNDYVLALQFFKDMLQEDLKPNDVAYLCLLSACSHGGMVEEGCRLFNTMREDHGIDPTLDHFNVLVDLLARAGHLNEAEDVLQTMPYPDDGVGWCSLMSHCKTHGNVVLAKRCFGLGATIDERHVLGLVVTLNIYAATSMCKDAGKVGNVRECVRAWKKPGNAFIETDLKAHNFIVGDKSHPNSDDIYSKLKDLVGQLKEQGHVPCFDLVAESSSDYDRINLIGMLSD